MGSMTQASDVIHAISDVEETTQEEPEGLVPPGTPPGITRGTRTARTTRIVPKTSTTPLPDIIKKVLALEVEPRAVAIRGDVRYVPL